VYGTLPVQEWSSKWTRRAYGVTIFTLLFALPALFVVAAYVLIVRQLTLEGRGLQLGGARSASGLVRSRRCVNVLSGRRRIASLLGAIAVAFAICWMPYHILRYQPINR